MKQWFKRSMAGFLALCICAAPVFASSYGDLLHSYETPVSEMGTVYTEQFWNENQSDLCTEQYLSRWATQILFPLTTSQYQSGHLLHLQPFPCDRVAKRAGYCFLEFSHVMLISDMKSRVYEWQYSFSAKTKTLDIARKPSDIKGFHLY